jgi:hypothetical protein
MLAFYALWGDEWSPLLQQEKEPGVDQIRGVVGGERRSRCNAGSRLFIDSSTAMSTSRRHATDRSGYAHLHYRMAIGVR